MVQRQGDNLGKEPQWACKYVIITGSYQTAEKGKRNKISLEEAEVFKQ